MKTSIIQHLFLIQFLLLASCVHSQRGPVAGGGDGNGAGGSVSFSLGQVDYMTVSGGGAVVMAGLQQPHELFIILGIDDGEARFDFSVYPNPTAEIVRLDLGGRASKQLRVELSDVHGKVLLRQALCADETTISLADFAQATYFLAVVQGETILQSFKIIKNH